MEKLVQLTISDATLVRIADQAYSTVTEVADVLRTLLDNDPAMIVSIETDNAEHYQAIGTAVYAAHRAGFFGENLRMSVAGKLVET